MEDIEIIDADKNLGKINNHMLVKATKNPNKEVRKQEGNMEFYNQENYLEVKNFTNKYKEKLCIKPSVK